MATDVRPSQQLDPALESILARLRRRIRAYVWVDGVAALLIFSGAAFWLALAFDWLFEPPRPLRAVLLVALAAALVYIVYRYLLARLAVRLRNRNMALLLERKFRQLGDSLLTAVELSQQPDHATQFNPDMLARVHRQALASAGGLNLGDVFNARPLARRITLAAALVVAVGVFAVAAPAAMNTFARRSLLLSDELWPRNTHLLVDGFDEQGRVKIARGSDWPLTVKADATLGRQIPDIVEVRYSTIDGARGRENMSREGVVAPGEGPFQPYAYTFKSVLTALEFRVAGGDDRAGPYYLDVVDSPTISRMTLRCEYPPYTRRAAREIPVAGLMQLPMGTQITILAESNKPLVDARIDEMADENAPHTHHIPLAEENGGPQNSFEFELPRLDADKTLLFMLHDADGIRSREAIRLAISAVPDEPPQVDVALRGIGTAITAAARLPAAGEVSDDYGVAKVWFEYQIDEAPPQKRTLNDSAGGREKIEVAGVMDVRALELQPKQRLHWSVQAADECALAGGPNVGTSQRYALEVVTPEQLRSILEARELMLRRRFETIIEELTDTRDLLAGLDLQQQPADQEGNQTKDKPDESTRSAEEKPAEGAARRRVSEAVQVERVLQNSERSSHETLQVALAFDEIRDEMINNRVDTKELRTRLGDGISAPLKQIVERRFSELLKRLKQLTATLSDPAAAVSTQTTAVAEIDTILIEMNQVLDKMLELETFNEVLDTLRQIIDAQDEVNEQTRRRQKRNLRDLIE